MFAHVVADQVIQIACETGITLDPVYTIKSVRGMLAEMRDNPSRFKGKKVLYIHTGEGNVELLMHEWVECNCIKEERLVMHCMFLCIRSGEEGSQWK